MRAGRLLSILLLLQLRVRLTADELAEELEVSVRTIYRDIEALSAAGVPVYGDRGPGGGFQLVDGYRTRLTGLAADEAEAVFLIGVPGTADAIGLGAAAESAGRKVLASLPQPLRDGAGRLGERIHMDPAEWYQRTEPTPHLPTLARAVLDQRVVAMTYESWTGIRDWRVDPLGLVLKASTWYVVARSDGTSRIYRVANIRALAVEDATFTRPDGFDLPTFWSAEIQRFERTLRPHHAVVRASPEGMRRLARVGAYAALAVREAQPADSDCVDVMLPIESVDDAALVLLGVGPEVVVVEPDALRSRIGELARAIADRASTTAPPRLPGS